MVLGSVSEKAGQKDAAADAYRAVLALDADNQQAKTALERLNDDK
jgi:predicted TPR repeat methyltransferase